MTYINRGLQEDYGCVICGKIPAYFLVGIEESDRGIPISIVLCEEHLKKYMREEMKRKRRI